MKNLKTATGYVLMFMLLAFVNGCTKDDDGSGGGNESPIGVWQRYGSPKGYNTDLAVGNIPGEPSNRVYMCEHPGSPSAGLYKGTISGNTISWDANHGLPDADFDAVGSERTLYFGVGALADAGKYERGVWTNTCGELKKATATCQYTQYTGTTSCSNSGYYPISSSACCPASSPYYCSETNKCYTTCENADAACTSVSVIKSNSGGGGGGSAGYNCVSGSCSYVSSGASYSTLSECQSACSSSGSCDATGMFFVKIYYKPTGTCAASDITHTLRFYTCCAHGATTNSVYAGIWTAGQDAGGVYRTCTFGNESQAICIHGTTLYNRMTRLEYTVKPQGSSNSICTQSGALDIDFQSQTKNLVIDWQ